MRRPTIVLLALLAAGRAADAATATLALAPLKAGLGDPLAARLTVSLEPGESVDTAPLPVAWGPAQVLSGAWEPAAPGQPRVWSGTVAVYQLGETTVPPVSVPILKGAERAEAATTAVTVTIEGTVPAGATPPPEIADLKPPASIPPDFGAVRAAAAAFLGLVVLALAAWLLWRRYAARLAAVATPADPFRKLPPHVWVYEELERLLARRLAEEGKVGQFYDELTHIVKQYLEGRYRVDLLERTTSEVPAALKSAGASSDAGALARALLESGDRVKFARLEAQAADCRAAVEEAYRLVDMTKPVEAPAPAPVSAAAGAGAGAGGTSR
ncbi:MAG TPA: hypothetical protein VFB67_07965 [Candidatus Polarisedimenticolaceae bacterium]|nr:hypothetical protein [Candidatus Polarisedimenticolaceae bacterium]